MRKIVVEITAPNSDKRSWIRLVKSYVMGNVKIKFKVLSDTADPQYALKGVANGGLEVVKTDPQALKMKDEWKPNTTSDTYSVPDVEEAGE